VAVPVREVRGYYRNDRGHQRNDRGYRDQRNHRDYRRN
jgi:hypothetical protein